MGRITLVGSAHRAHGKCNAAELKQILLTINPEVIFEEIHPNDFEAFYNDESKHSVEILAIKGYLSTRQAQQVPVDDYEMPETFGPYMLALEEFVVSRSSAYRAAINQINHKQAECGFSYLNSLTYVSEMQRAEQVYQDTVSTYGNELAKNKLAEWNDQIRNRDNSMLDNIYAFCKRVDFTEGVFLVGAGHLSSILNGIERRTKENPLLITWRFWSRP